MTSTVTPADLLAAAEGLGPQIRACRDEIERDRRLPTPLADAMTEAGLLRMWVPAACGGAEVDVATFTRVVEAVARADGAAGWSLSIWAGAGLFAAYLPDEGAREIYCHPRIVTGGRLSPSGRATAVDGGYRVSGRWDFASGGEQCDWLGGNCLVLDGDAPRLLPNGVPEARVMMFPAEDFRIIDTWSVGGLRGTGSHDFVVEDVFVPARRSLSLADGPVQTGTLYGMPILGLLALSVAAVPLGIARGAIDALVQLAAVKTPTFSRQPLCEKPVAQTQVSQAEALLRSARAFLFEAIDDAWRTVDTGREASQDQRATLRLAATNASISAAQAVDLMYSLGGASSLFTSNPLERAFRDVHAATQHAMVAPAVYESTGRHFFGLPVDRGYL